MPSVDRPQRLIVALAALVAFAPLSIDTYLPSLPLIASDLASRADEVQLTISLFLAGLCVGMLFLGPLSDRYGRRRLLIGGIALYLLASDYEIRDDWYAAGMKGSGTKTLIVKDAFVPNHRIQAAKDMMEGKSAGFGLYPYSKIFYTPYRPYFASGFSAISLGIAERMLEAFAVVAEEVRALAHRTKNSTHEIEVLIGGIQDVTERAVSSMQRSSESAEITLSLAGSADQALRDIRASIETIIERSRVIAVAADQQEGMMERVNQSLLKIQGLFQEASEGVNQTDQASGDLSELAGLLQKLVSRFEA